MLPCSLLKWKVCAMKGTASRHLSEQLCVRLHLHWQSNSCTKCCRQQSSEVFVLLCWESACALAAQSCTPITVQQLHCSMLAQGFCCQQQCAAHAGLNNRTTPLATSAMSPSSPSSHLCTPPPASHTTNSPPPQSAHYVRRNSCLDISFAVCPCIL